MSDNVIIVQQSPVTVIAGDTTSTVVSDSLGVVTQASETIVIVESLLTNVEVSSLGPQGIQGPAGTTSILSQESPTGAINGVNVTFFLSQIPKDDFILFFLNGVSLTEGSDYTLSTATITMVSAPVIGDMLTAYYLEN